MNTTWKNCLQEYCQKNKLSLPSYRIKKQTGPSHSLKFQVEVEVNGHGYAGDDLFTSKKDAEQSAAKKAWTILLARNVDSSSPETLTAPTSETYLEAPPSYVEVIETHSGYHLPDEYTNIEQFIAGKVGAFGGRIRKIWPPDSQGRYKFEISGTYRYCENIKRHHKQNQIYFIVDPIKNTYVQRCHDSECYGFQSTAKQITNDQTTPPNSQENACMSECSHCQKPLKYQNQKECERCGEIFCKNCVCICELCHDAIHCDRCFESCFDCHDS